MSIRTRMIARATVERNSETGTDAHGHPLVEAWAFHLTLPCRVYNDNKRLIIDGDKTATIGQLRIAYPLLNNNGKNIDVTEADRITAVKDRKGTSLYTDDYDIRQITRKYTHYEADLKAIE